MDTQKKNLIIGITGASGDLGKRLVFWLLEKDFVLRCLVRNQNQYIPNQYCVYGDITNYNTLIPFIKNLDILVHLAAQVKCSNKMDYYKVNVEGTNNICEIILKYNPRCRLIYMSSVSILNISIWNRLFATHYSISKFNAEKRVNFFIDKRYLKAKIIYPGYIYGPNNMKFIIGIIKFLKGNFKFYLTKGNQFAPITHIDDLCCAIEKVILGKIKLNKLLVINLKKDISIKKIIKVLCIALKTKEPRVTFPTMFMYIIAILLEIFCKMIKASSPLTKRHIHALCFEFNPCRSRFRNIYIYHQRKDFEKEIYKLLPLIYT